MAISAGNRRAWGKASRQFAQVLLDAGYTVKGKALDSLDKACDEAIRSIDWMWPRGANNGPYASGYHGGDDEHPWYSGTLHDSVAGGVFDGTRLLRARYITPSGASTEISENASSPRKGTVVGADEGQRALMAAGQFSSGGFGPGVGGLRAIFVVGVPYADYVNSSPLIGWPKHEKPNTHIGFAESLGEYFVGEVAGAVQELSKLQIRPKK